MSGFGVINNTTAAAAAEEEVAEAETSDRVTTGTEIRITTTAREVEAEEEEATEATRTAETAQGRVTLRTRGLMAATEAADTDLHHHHDATILHTVAHRAAEATAIATIGGRIIAVAAEAEIRAAPLQEAAVTATTPGPLRINGARVAATAAETAAEREIGFLLVARFHLARRFSAEATSEASVASANFLRLSERAEAAVRARPAEAETPAATLRLPSTIPLPIASTLTRIIR